MLTAYCTKAQLYVTLLDDGNSGGGRLVAHGIPHYLSAGLKVYDEIG